MNTPPAPTLIPNLPDADYHAWNLLSNSRLSDLDVSPEWCAWVRKHGKEQTDAMKLGTALHTAVLEPDRLAREFVEPKPCCGTFKLKKGEATPKVCGAMSAKPYGNAESPDWFCGKHNKDVGDPLPLDTITASQRFALGHMRSNILRYADAERLLDMADDRELSIVFNHDAQLCKARVDAYVPHGAGFIVDLKTCPDPTAEPFARTAMNRGYYRQLAFYRRALAAHGRPVGHAMIIAVQSVAPFAVRVYQVAAESIDLGDADLDRLMADYQRREASGDWIGHGGKAQTLEMPRWATDRVERRVADAVA